MLSLMVMLRLELPHINVLSKVDLVEQMGPLPFNLEFFTECQDMRQLLAYLDAPPDTGEGGGDKEESSVLADTQPRDGSPRSGTWCPEDEVVVAPFHFGTYFWLIFRSVDEQRPGGPIHRDRMLFPQSRCGVVNYVRVKASPSREDERTSALRN
ncbi:unnamed protein product [Sphacelaria rigidula]